MVRRRRARAAHEHEALDISACGPWACGARPPRPVLCSALKTARSRSQHAPCVVQQPRHAAAWTPSGNSTLAQMACALLACGTAGRLPTFPPTRPARSHGPGREGRPPADKPGGFHPPGQVRASPFLISTEQRPRPSSGRPGGRPDGSRGGRRAVKPLARGAPRALRYAQARAHAPLAPRFPAPPRTPQVPQLSGAGHPRLLPAPHGRQDTGLPRHGARRGAGG